MPIGPANSFGILGALRPMPLSAGVRLGTYEIVGALGAGGMGEVNRARDTRLRRDVALKILPAEVSADPSRRARFEQEAQAAAALNHPNIMSVYDVGGTDDASYIATELVSGETLAALVERAQSRYGPSRDLFHELRSLRDHLSEISTQVEPQTATPPARPADRRVACSCCCIPAWTRRPDRLRPRPDGSAASRSIRVPLYAVLVRGWRAAPPRVCRGRQGCRVRRAADGWSG